MDAAALAESKAFSHPPPHSLGSLPPGLIVVPEPTVAQQSHPTSAPPCPESGGGGGANQTEGAISEPPGAAPYGWLVPTVGRCTLDPGLKAPCFQPVNLRVRKLLFNLTFELAPLHHG